MQKISIFVSYHTANFNPGVKHGESEASGLFAPTTPPQGFFAYYPHRGFSAGKNYFFSSIGIGVFCGSGST